ncbi:hypothetical protein GFL80_15000 [Rhizobium leguminosarum bv. viciae]|uniref:hypothetical protein n=1 Tax=Rhizobium leguminosarum TaxID=384 RepID=UPI0014428842|nr:hypothetical protein [Rhizobium leguminosarum]NKK85544.1 hypothetical protein [Rhizobium leguminosarum bv. viciae]
MTEEADKRWKVTITYRYDDGPRKTVSFIEEIAELEDIIEHGLDWNAMVDCRITYNGANYPEGSTVEQIAAA